MQHQNKTNQDLTNVLRWWQSFTEGQRQDWTRNPRGSHSCARAPVFKAQNTHNLRKNAHKISGPAVVCAVHRVMMTEWRVFANYFPPTLIINIFALPHWKWHIAWLTFTLPDAVILFIMHDLHKIYNLYNEYYTSSPAFSPRYPHINNRFIHIFKVEHSFLWPDQISDQISLRDISIRCPIAPTPPNLMPSRPRNCNIRRQHQHPHC